MCIIYTHTHIYTHTRIHIYIATEKKTKRPSNMERQTSSWVERINIIHQN